MKKQFYLVLDVEGARDIDNALVYDVGGAITDRAGIIYDKFSFVVKNIFGNGDNPIMDSAYYAIKIPRYRTGLKNGEFQMKNFYNVREHIKSLIEKYGVKEVMAFNASYDIRALNNTQKHTTQDRYKWFLPYGIKVSCIWHMACQTICKKKSYRTFCRENNLITPKNNIKTSAETVYAFMINNPNFIEEHTGLKDVEIEVSIMAKCFAMKKKMNRKMNRACWRIPQKIG